MSAATGFFILVLVLSGAALAAQIVRRQLRTKQLRSLASQTGLHYSAVDRFGLAERIAPKLDCPGAANVHVSDLLYGMKDERLRYVFTVDYTRGALRTRRTPRRVVLVSEPKNRAARDGNLQLTTVDGALNLIHQYQQLIRGADGGLGSRPTAVGREERPSTDG